MKREKRESEAQIVLNLLTEMKFQKLILAVVPFLLAACSSTPRGLQHVPAQPLPVVDAAQDVKDLDFASTTGRLEVGTTSVVPNTPIGTAQATVTTTYVNALGETCKRIHLKNQSGETDSAVCLGKDNVWRHVPALQ